MQQWQVRAVHQPKVSYRNNRVINFPTGILDGSFNILFFQVWQLFQNLLIAKTSDKKIQHVNNTDSHSSDARSSTTLIGIYSYALSPDFHFVGILLVVYSKFT